MVIPESTLVQAQVHQIKYADDTVLDITHEKTLLQQAAFDQTTNHFSSALNRVKHPTPDHRTSESEATTAAVCLHICAGVSLFEGGLRDINPPLFVCHSPAQ